VQWNDSAAFDGWSSDSDRDLLHKGAGTTRTKAIRIPIVGKRNAVVTARRCAGEKTGRQQRCWGPGLSIWACATPRCDSTHSGVFLYGIAPIGSAIPPEDERAQSQRTRTTPTMASPHCGRNRPRLCAMGG
jgi:hypothetical protein